MKIDPCPEFRKQLLERIAKREFKERTGVHSSDLIYCLNKQALRRLKPKPINDNDLLLYSLGWSTQRWLTGQDEDEPEIEVDGIIVTADAVVIEGRGKAVWELKCTFQSSNKPIEESIHWLRQMMAQCYVIGTKVAYLSRLEVMGNWKSIFGKKEEKALPENQKPTLSVFRIEFTQEELDANWRWMKNRRIQYNQILETGILLPKAQALASGMEFECDRCPYREEFS